MEYVVRSVVLLHLLAFAAFVGGGMRQLVRRGEPEIGRLMVWGAIGGLLTGLALMGGHVLGVGYAGPVNWIVLTAKAVLAVGVCVLTISNRRFVSIPRGLVMLLLGLGAVEAVLGLLCR